MNTLACVICGHEGTDVRSQLVRWAEVEDGGNTYDFIPRCNDRAACKQRCQAVGEPWPVAEPGQKTRVLS